METTTDDVWAALLDNRERAIRVARARGAHPDDVEDVVQEAMARVAAMADVDLARVGSLVTVVVANLAVDGHRARARGVRLDERFAAGSVPEPPPDEAVCDTDEARWLWSLREELGEQDRRVLELRADGRSLAEAADELGVTYKAAENALGRARKRLKTAWAVTAALLGILWGRRPFRVGTASVSLPAAVLAAATFGAVAPAQSLPGVATPADVGRPAVVRTDLGAAGLSNERPASPSAAAPDHTTRPPAPAPSSKPRDDHAGDGRGSLFDTTVEVMEHEVTVTVERHETGRTLTEEIEHCLREGPVVRPDLIGCPP